MSSSLEPISRGVSFFICIQNSFFIFIYQGSPISFGHETFLPMSTPVRSKYLLQNQNPQYRVYQLNSMELIQAKWADINQKTSLKSKMRQFTSNHADIRFTNTVISTIDVWLQLRTLWTRLNLGIPISNDWFQKQQKMIGLMIAHHWRSSMYLKLMNH
jgi:hypothetical protein